jgi:hypothetical protein
VQEEVILPSDYHSDCSKQACEMCMRAESLIEKYRSFDSRSTLKYQKWVKQANSRFSKLTSEVTLEEAIDEVQHQIRPVIIHHQTKRQQSDAYKLCKAKANLQMPVVQIDFAENYTCDHQDEIQSAYYNKKQVPLFTYCVWMEGKKQRNIMILSDCLEHNKTFVCLYLMEIIKRLGDEAIFYFFDDLKSSVHIS